MSFISLDDPSNNPQPTLVSTAFDASSKDAAKAVGIAALSVFIPILVNWLNRRLQPSRPVNIEVEGQK